LNLEPLKIVYQLVVIEKDDDGNIVAEHPQEPATLYPPQFGELEERVKATLESTPVYANGAAPGATAPAPVTPLED
jgi:hypothetical protein